MKKFLLRAIVLMSIMTVILIGVVGCGGPEATNTNSYTDALNKTSTCTEIVQTVEVNNGRILVYMQKQTYKKAEVGYTVTTEEKRLNKLGEDEAYTETKTEDKVQIVSSFTSVLRLNEENFETQETKDGKFTAKIKDSAVKSVFALDDAKATIKDAKLEMELENGKLIKMTITCKADDDDVAINISYKY